MRYYFSAFKNYAKCDGRATRKEYWWFILFHYIVVFSLSFLDGFLGFYSAEIPLNYGYMTLIYLFASACPAICLQVRRLHDVGESGSWWWAKNVPILSLYVFYLNCKASEPGINYYSYPANYTPTSAFDEDRKLGQDEWKCSCGQIHKDYVSSCSCGQSKRMVLLAKSTAVENATTITNTKNSHTEDANTPSAESPIRSTPAIRFCRKCGFEFLPDSDFCSNCGTAIIKK